MTEEKKKQLFPYFAYLYSQQLNPEKYGNAESIEEWTSLIQESPEDIEEITSAASGLSDDDWAEIEAQYNEEQSSDEVEMAKKGAKLKKLKEFKKGAKMGKKKKCACGCDLISKKEFGGTIVDTCTCCGEVHKHQEGGIMKFQNPSSGIREVGSGWYQGYDEVTKFKTSLSRDRAVVERILSDYVNNPNIRKAVAQAEWEARPSTGNFNATQSPHYFGNVPVPQVAQQVQSFSNRTSSNTPQGVAPASTPTPEPAKTTQRGGTGGAPQKGTTQSNGLTSTSGAVRTPSRNNAKRVPAQSDRLTSIVDYLNADGVNSSFANRKELAHGMGIRNYVGSAQQNTQLINLLRQNKNTELASARMEIPSMAQPAPAVASIPTPSLSKTLLVSNRKGGLIKKAQKGAKTKGGYIGNNETWDPKSVGTGDNSMNPKDWSPEKKKADREAWLNRNKKVTTKPVPSKKVELPKRNK